MKEISKLVISKYPIASSPFLFYKKYFNNTYAVFVGVFANNYTYNATENDKKTQKSNKYNIFASNVDFIEGIKHIFTTNILLNIVYFIPCCFQILLDLIHVLCAKIQGYSIKEHTQSLFTNDDRANPAIYRLFLFYQSILGYIKLNELTLKHKPKNIYCSNLTELLIAIKFKKKYKSKIIYYTDTIRWSNTDNFQRRTFAKFEQKLFKHIDEFFLPSKNIKNLFFTYRVHHTILNRIFYDESIFNALNEKATLVINIFTIRFRTCNIFPVLNIQNCNVLIHAYAIYTNNILGCLRDIVLQPIAKLGNKKCFFIQDECSNIHKMMQILDAFDADFIFSVAGEKNLDILYDTKVLPKTKKINVLTGYVSENIKNNKIIPMENRQHDITYRGMQMPFHFGKLAHDKSLIAEKCLKECSGKDLKIDIATDSQKKFVGQEWIDFLMNSRTVLATSSGISIVDFTGNISTKVSEYVEQNPNATFDEVHTRLLVKYERNAVIDTISPRHLEAIALKVVQIMPIGYFGGILKADVHYIALNKDYSNIAEILEQIKDLNYLQKIADRAYKDIILSGKYDENVLTNLVKKALD